jgi:hypothetical protein
MDSSKEKSVSRVGWVSEFLYREEGSDMEPIDHGEQLDEIWML